LKSERAKKAALDKNRAAFLWVPAYSRRRFKQRGQALL
jgi:hypothetical protein